jgi:hypothetical protein
MSLAALRPFNPPADPNVARRTLIVYPMTASLPGGSSPCWRSRRQLRCHYRRHRCWPRRCSSARLGWTPTSAGPILVGKGLTWVTERKDIRRAQLGLAAPEGSEGPRSPSAFGEVRSQKKDYGLVSFLGRERAKLDPLDHGRQNRSPGSQITKGQSYEYSQHGTTRRYWHSPALWGKAA